MRGADYVFPVRIYNVPTGLTIFLQRDGHEPRRAILPRWIA